jgi:hypothetical protein
MIQTIFIDTHRSDVQVDMRGLFGGNFCEFVLHLGLTVLSVAQFYTVTLAGPYIDTLMATRQVAITKEKNTHDI